MTRLLPEGLEFTSVFISKPCRFRAGDEEISSHLIAQPILDSQHHKA